MAQDWCLMAWTNSLLRWAKPKHRMSVSHISNARFGRSPRSYLQAIPQSTYATPQGRGGCLQSRPSPPSSAGSTVAVAGPRSRLGAQGFTPFQRPDLLRQLLALRILSFLALLARPSSWNPGTWHEKTENDRFLLGTFGPETDGNLDTNQYVWWGLKLHKAIEEACRWEWVQITRLTLQITR